MKKRILDVGQCALDHGNIGDLLTRHFDVEIDRAHSHEEALSLCQQKNYDLILVNRIYDRDGSAGHATIEQLCKAVPQPKVMLVSNYPDAQQAAVQAGALPGFGKAKLSDARTAEALKSILGE